MRASRVVLCLLVVAGLAACATPGQVQRVETAVQLADHERARGDSAQRAELARIEIAQRQAMDTMLVIYRQLTDAMQRMSRENASGFDDLRQRLYQVVTAQSTVAAGVNKLRNQVDAAVSSAPVAPPSSDTTGGRAGNATIIPQPDALIDQAQQALRQSAYASARRSLNLVLTNYPQSPQVADATYWLGYSFDAPETVDSARSYYNRVVNVYPKADKAPTALFKLGNLELKAGNVATARKYWQLILKDYPQSLEASRVPDLLRDNP